MYQPDQNLTLKKLLYHIIWRGKLNFYIYTYNLNKNIRYRILNKIVCFVRTRTRVRMCVCVCAYINKYHLHKQYYKN